MRSKRQAPRPGTIKELLFSPALRLRTTSKPIVSGKLFCPGLQIPCSIGRAGTTSHKIEGDGKTPRGRFKIVSGFWRADRYKRPRTSLLMRPTRLNDGWCDDIRSGLYNRRVSLPSFQSHEELWRIDCLYDFVLVLDYNYARRSKARGSAIFFHIWRDNCTPTEGCIAIDAKHMTKLLSRLAVDASLTIR